MGYWNYRYKKNYYNNNKNTEIENENKDDNANEIKNEKCILCEEETDNNYLFCLDCYRNKIKPIRQNFDHNRNENNIRDHYFELKQLTKKSNNLEEIKDNISIMFALSEEFQNIYDDDYLTKIANKDILEIMKNSKNIETSQKFNDEDFRNKWPREHQCDDGHYVRSEAEKIIDDWLYRNNYVHAYEKSVYMDTEPNAVVLSDFYLPEGDVYIEFWGIEDNEKYNNRKETKIKLYDENKYNRIDLTMDDIKRINDIMPRKLGQFIKRRK